MIRIRSRGFAGRLSLAVLMVPALISAAVLPTGGQPEERLAFTRPSDLGLRITHTAAHRFSEGRASLQQGDQEERELPNAFALSTEVSTSLVDEPRGSGPGVRRAYLGVEGVLRAGAPGPNGEVIGPSVQLTSPLVDRGVAFVPAEGQPRGFGRHYDSVAEADERFLPRLEAPTDWAGLTPPEGTTGRAVGDTWDVDAAALRCIVAPVGFLALDGEATDEDADTLDPRMRRALQNGVGANLQLAFDGRLDGRAKARVKEVAVDGRDGSVSVVEVEFALNAGVDRTAALAEAHALGKGEPTTDVLSAAVELGLEGTATLRWSHELDRPTLVTVVADETIVFTVGLIGTTQEVSVETLRLEGAYAARTVIGDSLLLGSSRER